MNVLVTGGAGFIGSAVVRRLVNAGGVAAGSISYRFDQVDICDAEAVPGS
jgi:nucleoside-diphosphate-sugar epimerase